jgi:hypothetical protein
MDKCPARGAESQTGISCIGTLPRHCSLVEPGSADGSGSKMLVAGEVAITTRLLVAISVEWVVTRFGATLPPPLLKASLSN